MGIQLRPGMKTNCNPYPVVWESLHKLKRVGSLSLTHNKINELRRVAHRSFFKKQLIGYCFSLSDCISYEDNPIAVGEEEKLKDVNRL